MRERSDDRGVNVPIWAVAMIITLVIQTVTLVFGYGELRQQVLDLDRDVQQIKQQIQTRPLTP